MDGRPTVSLAIANGWITVKDNRTNRCIIIVSIIAL